MIPKDYLLKIIDNALKEDIGTGDHSSLACIPRNVTGEAIITAKQKGVIAGIDVAKQVFFSRDNKLNLKTYLKDGDLVEPGTRIMKINGNKINILEAERTALNFMQRMSGIASLTNQYVQKISKYKTKLLDTRKTTPGLRLIEKYAVKTGGAFNHRIGLYDMIMLKDNHIDFAGGINNAIVKTNEYIKNNNLDINIVIEVRSFEELSQVMEVGGVNRVMLDNFSISNTKKAVKIIDGKFEVESSGGINFDNIEKYAECGVDYISVGAITHQAQSLDISLNVI